MPTLSIIIPTFNSAKTLAVCLDSIVNQTFQDLEVWLIDGVSGDITLEIIKEYATKYNFINYISEPDKGIYDAMNKGIDLAKGEWLYFLGSDDSLYDENTLKNVNKELQLKNYKIIYGNVLIKGNAAWAKNNEIYAGSFKLSQLLKKNICHQSMFFNKTVFEKKMYNLKFKVCADYDFNLFLFSKYQFKYINQIIANFNAGGFSTSSVENEFHISESVIAYFYFYLIRNEFKFIKNDIKLKALQSKSYIEVIYLNAIYLKHKIF